MPPKLTPTQAPLATSTNKTTAASARIASLPSPLRASVHAQYAPTPPPPPPNSLAGVRQLWRNMDASLGASMAELSAKLRRELDATLSALAERPNKPSDACRASLNVALDALARQELWAVQMLDASATRVPAGVLAGTLTDLGNFDECLAINAGADAARRSKRVQTQHCSVVLRAPLPPRPRMHTICQRLPALASNASAERPLRLLSSMAQNLHYVGLRLGLCAPRACSPADLRALVGAYVQRYELSAQIQSCQAMVTRNHRGQRDNFLAKLKSFLNADAGVANEAAFVNITNGSNDNDDIESADSTTTNDNETNHANVGSKRAPRKLDTENELAVDTVGARLDFVQRFIV